MILPGDSNQKQSFLPVLNSENNDIQFFQINNNASYWQNNSKVFQEFVATRLQLITSSWQKGFFLQVIYI